MLVVAHRRRRSAVVVARTSRGRRRDPPPRAPGRDRDRRGRRRRRSPSSAAIFWPGGVDAALAEAAEARDTPATTPTSIPSTIAGDRDRRPPRSTRTTVDADDDRDRTRRPSPTTKAGDRRRDPGGVHGGAAVPAGPVPVERARRARRGPVGARRRARPARARRSSPSTRSPARSPTGAKAFYTTPLKALSNQKYGDFVRALRRASGSACSPATTRSTATRRSS